MWWSSSGHTHSSQVWGSRKTLCLLVSNLQQVEPWTSVGWVQDPDLWCVREDSAPAQRNGQLRAVFWDLWSPQAPPQRWKPLSSFQQFREGFQGSERSVEALVGNIWVLQPCCSCIFQHPSEQETHLKHFIWEVSILSYKKKLFFPFFSCAMA